MKKILIVLSILFIGFWGCKKKNKELPAPENAVIELIKLNDNSYIFKNATPSGGSGTKWTFGDVGTSTQYQDTVFFAFPGTYNITMTSNSKGGISSAATSITVEHLAVDYAADFELTPIENDPFRFKVKVTTPFAKHQTFTSSVGHYDTTAVDTVYIPFMGSHEISVTVIAGSKVVKDVPSTKTKTVTVASDDMSNPDLNDRFFKVLTGGLDDVDGRTWLFCTTANLSGKGKYFKRRFDYQYYKYPDGYGTEYTVGGGADNEYTFKMRNYQYIPKNNNVTVHYDWATLDFRMPYKLYNDIAYSDPKHKPAPFVMKNDGIGMGYSLYIRENSYISFWQDKHNYELAKISATEDTIWIRQRYGDLNTDPAITAPDPAKNVPSNDQNQKVMIFYLKK